MIGAYYLRAQLKTNHEKTTNLIGRSLYCIL